MVSETRQAGNNKSSPLSTDSNPTCSTFEGVTKSANNKLLIIFRQQKITFQQQQHNSQVTGSTHVSIPNYYIECVMCINKNYCGMRYDDDDTRASSVREN